MEITRIQQLGAFAPYQKIKEDMLNLINRQLWKEGEKIPTEMALASKYGVSRLTVRKALKQLEADGIIVPRQGSGRIVARRPEQDCREKSIGIICHKFGSAYGEVDLISELAEQQGYKAHLYLLQGMTTNESLTQQLQQMSDENISGIIILCQEILASHIMKWNCYVPIVAAYHDFSVIDIPSFYIDWRWIGYEASSFFFESGFDYQLILLNNRSFFRYIDNMILDGFNYAHHQRGKTLQQNQLFFMPSVREADYTKSLEQVYETIAGSTQSGVFSYFHWPLLHIINHRQEKQLDIPERLSLICASDSAMLRQAPLPITAFAIDRQYLIKTAFNALLQQIEGTRHNDSDFSRPVSIYGKLQERATTKQKK